MCIPGHPLLTTNSSKVGMTHHKTTSCDSARQYTTHPNFPDQLFLYQAPIILVGLHIRNTECNFPETLTTTILNHNRRYMQPIRTYESYRIIVCIVVPHRAGRISPLSIVREYEQYCS
jgi:hypothetical protein